MPAHDTARDGADGTGDLAALGAHAILIGTPDHVPGSELPALPAVTGTLDDLEALLKNACGLRGDRVHRVPADATQGDVVAAVEGAVREATGPILLCYVGHGILGPADELYLATRAGRSPERIADAVPYGTLRNLLTEAPGGSVVILDCCYSGRAKAPGGRAEGPPPFVVTRPGGSYLLSSASWYDLSYAPEGRRHTLFGGKLIELLGEGDPAGPPWLTLDGLHEALDRAFQGGPIRPWRQSEGTLGSLRLARNRAYAEPRTPSDPPADVPCPYPGMEPFGTTQTRHFFGREDLVRLLLDVVCDSRRAREAGGTAPVVLVGQSGVGKTSLLTAGLLAALERRHAEGTERPERPEPSGQSDRSGRSAPSGHAQPLTHARPSGHAGLPWPAVLLPAPGPHPVRALAEVWSRATGRPAEEVYRALSTGRLPEPRPGRERCRLLVVDQFEEVFTRCTDAEERTRFIDVLTSPEGTAEPPRVVLGLRGDHYGDCLTHPGLARALDHGLFNVRPMDDDALRAAVERPAQAAGLALEPGLTDRLLRDLRHGDGGHGRDAALPFLAHALRETWLRRSGATLTLAGYEATGGIWHAVTTTTDRLYEELDQDGREALRELLLRLVHVTDDGVAVRRGVPLDSLLDGLPVPQQAATRAVRERLAAARLITVDQDHAQIAHEALLAAWPRLRQWAEEDRDLLVRRQRLADSAEEWVAAGRHADFLLTGVKLDAAGELLDGDRLPRVEREFVEASFAADLTRWEAQTRLNRRLTWRLRAALVGLCLALVATGYAFRQSTEADRQRTAAEQQRAEADRQRDSAVEQRRLGTVRALEAEAENQRTKDPQLSLRLGLAAHRLRPTAESRAAVFGTLAGTGYGGSSTSDVDVENSVLSHDGRTQAAADGDQVVLWDVSDAARRRQLTALPGCAEHSGSRVAFSADDRTIAAACDGGSVILWSLADVKHPRRTAVLRVEGLKGDPAGVAFSPRGDLLAAAGWGSGRDSLSQQAVVLWRLSAGRAPRRIAVERGVNDNRAVLFSPDGRTLVSSTGMSGYKEEPADRNSLTRPKGATLWDVSTPARPRRLARLDRVDEETAFSPDGRILATEASGGRVVLWNVADPSRPRKQAEWAAHKDFVTAFAFNPAGTRLAMASFDESITVWNIANRAEPKKESTLRGHQRTPDALVFGRNDGTLTSVDGQTVIRWRLTPLGRPRVLASIADQGAIRSAVFTHGGRTLATAGFDEAVSLWSMRQPGRPERLASMDLGAFVQDLAVSADGTTLAAADRRGRITLWDITTPARPRKLSVVNRGRVGYEMDVSLSPRATTLAANGAETLLSTGWLATWDLTDRKRPKHVRTVKGYPSSRVDFGAYGELRTINMGSALSHDGRLWADSELGRGLRILDLHAAATPRTVGRVTGDDWDVTGDPSFHPGGHLLSAMNESGDVLFADIGDLRRTHLAARLSHPTEKLELLAFSPDGRLAVTGRSDSTLQIWDLASLPALSADPIGMACKLAGQGLGRDAWATYAPGVPYQDSCPRPGTPSAPPRRTPPG
ncbi:hypothetical protein AMK26_15305 [Streptomyces sp. CB03234]|uniref:WD40 repeat domain-containing protein n=1 Tax=Streptomyces sp. (strain CB03234) TaxID=1703937 RepID=UPI00093C4700|nr:WD40 repeat domain-containing protein [Streptomyces sp. CB03234]OKK04679.1 hypothetical protein AMK26_15305 [Streptomyces sp. CB03234]